MRGADDLGQYDTIGVVKPVGAMSAPLGDNEWTLVELDGERIEPGADMCALTLVLDLEEAHVSGSGGVNRIKGTFALSESELRFGPLATTMMAGPDPAMQRERAFLDALARVTSYELDGRLLTLLSGGRRSAVVLNVVHVAKAEGATLRRLWSTVPNAS